VSRARARMGRGCTPASAGHLFFPSSAARRLRIAGTGSGLVSTRLQGPEPEADARTRTGPLHCEGKTNERHASTQGHSRGRSCRKSGCFTAHRSGREYPLVPELTYPFCTRVALWRQRAEGARRLIFVQPGGERRIERGARDCSIRREAPGSRSAPARRPERQSGPRGSRRVNDADMDQARARAR
jgi:hypothetical protein